MLKIVYQGRQELPLKKDMLERVRLNQLFEEAIQNSLVYVVAGAGYGKTQAVSKFLETANVRRAWVNLCELDNQTSRFWERFSYVLAQQDMRLSTKLRDLGFPNSLDKYNQFLNLLAKIVYSGKQLVIVFDDFHFIYENEIYRFVKMLNSSDIENISIFILTRNWINLEMVSAKGSSTARIIEKEELVFSLKETMEFFELRKKSHMKKSVIKEVWKATEGWPLAISLAANSEKSIEELSQNTAVVFQSALSNLFENEVFSGYTDKVQRILLKLSLIERFRIEDMRDISQEYFNEMLEVMRTNMFIHYNHYLKLYTFHNLYIDFLREKQAILTNKEKQQVYLLTAKSCESRDLKIEAIQYYRLCKAHEDIWRILKKLSLDCSVETAVFYMELIEEFPKRMLEDDPLIEVVYARLLLNNAEITKCSSLVEKILKKAESDEDEERKSRVMGETYIILGWLKLIFRDYTYAEDFVKAAEYLPGGSIFVSKTTFSNNACYAIAPRSEEYGEVDLFLKTICKAIPAWVKAFNGSGYGLEYLEVAECAYYRNQMNTAVQNAHLAVYNASQKEQYDILTISYFVLLRASVAGGKWEEVQRYLHELPEKVHADGLAGWIVDIVEGWFYSKIGMIDLVPTWIKDDKEYLIQPPSNDDGRNKFICAYCYLEEERYLELAAYVEYIEQHYVQRKAHILPAHIELQIIKSITSYKLGQLKEASEAFKKAYELSYKNDLIVFFIEYGNYMRSLINSLKRMDDFGVPVEWMNNIYSKSATYAKRLNYIKTKYREEDAPYENDIKLTRRQKDILIYLSHGLTREEIAEEKSVTMNTIKSEIKMIYNKLGAINSCDAIRIVTKMNII